MAEAGTCGHHNINYSIMIKYTLPTVLLSKRVHNYQCIVYVYVWLLQIFRVKLACILFPFVTQLGQWMDYLHLKRQAELTFHRASACKNVRKLWIFMLGTLSQHSIIVKNTNLR